ncbi:hypothetical protein AB9A94_14590 [Escherichia coli]
MIDKYNEVSFRARINPLKRRDESDDENPQSNRGRATNYHHGNNFWTPTGRQDFLTEFLLQIYTERGIGANQLNSYITRHMRDVKKRHPDKTNKDISSIRGNVIKELNRGSMPFRNFMNKLRLIRAREVTFTISITDSVGYTTTHTKRYFDATIPVDDPDAESLGSENEEV